MTTRPNLLLITTDQQRGDCLGCDGHPVLETPYLDQLAERGTRFRHAYTSVPSCTPARAARPQLVTLSGDTLVEIILKCF